MKLSIFSLKNILFQDDAQSLNCDTDSGELTILDHHEPLITNIKEGLIKIVDKDSKTRYIQVKEGFLEMRSNNELKCIIEEGKKE